MPVCNIATSMISASVFFAMGLVLFLGVLTLWVWRQPAFTGRSFFLVTLLSMCWWLFTVMMEHWTPSSECKILWARAAWLGIGALPPAWFFFCYTYSFSVSSRAHIRGLILTATFAGLASVIAATNPLHNGLYGPQTAPQLDILGTPIAFDHGPLFYMLAALLYVFMIGSLAIILQGSFGHLYLSPIFGTDRRNNRLTG